MPNDLTGLPNFFLAGCQKTASTWLWKCFLEHPDIYVPTEKDRINYFNIHYPKGIDWLKNWYRDWQGEKAVGETTPCYLSDPFAPKRIQEYNPNAKILFVFRNPIERAYSLYWHQKRKRAYNYQFRDVLHHQGVGTFNLYNDWIVTSFYHHWLQNWLVLFPKDQIKIMIYEDLLEDPKAYLKEVFSFLKVASDFMPSVIETRVNAGDGGQQSILSLKKQVKQMFQSPQTALEKEDITPEDRQALLCLFEEENQKLAAFLGRDLSFWQ